MNRINASVILVVAAITLSSCLRDFDTPEEQDQQIREYLAANNITAQSDENGVYYFPISENPSGDELRVQDIVSFYYSIILLDGSTVEILQEADGPPIESFHNVGQLVPVGVDLGMRQMRVGETFGFIIPTRFAYSGISITGLIPLDAIIRAEIEVVAAVEDDVHEAAELVGINQYITDLNIGAFENLGDGLRYKTTEAGVSGTTPTESQSIVIDYTATLLNGEEFDQETQFVVILDENRLVPGLVTGLKRMLRDETAIIVVPSRQGFITSPLVIPQQLSNIPVKPLSVLVYQVKRVI